MVSEEILLNGGFEYSVGNEALSSLCEYYCVSDSVTVKCERESLADLSLCKDFVTVGSFFKIFSIAGELCTPTGAALLKHFATRFGDMPVMQTEAVGYGMGKRDFEAANCLRAMLGSTQDPGDSITELCCNVDDMTAEQIAFALERLLEGGALDAYTTAIGMKKSRPATMISVICAVDDCESMAKLLFKHTTTIGIRRVRAERYLLRRSIAEIDTPFGAVRRKDCSGYGVARSKYEYEDVARIAREQDMSIEEVIAAIEK